MLILMEKQKIFPHNIFHLFELIHLNSGPVAKGKFFKPLNCCHTQFLCSSPVLFSSDLPPQTYLYQIQSAQKWWDGRSKALWKGVFSFRSSFAVDLFLKFPASCFYNGLVHERVCNIKCYTPWSMMWCWSQVAQKRASGHFQCSHFRAWL